VMNATENGQNGPEIGLWTAYDSQGAVVGQGTLVPREAVSIGSNV
jgi:hypothetical protein